MEHNNDRYKTSLCKQFEMNGTCNYGEKCKYAHGSSDLRQPTGGGYKRGGFGANNFHNKNYKTSLCHQWQQQATCRYGDTCKFAHGDNEIQAKGGYVANNQNAQQAYQMQYAGQDPAFWNTQQNLALMAQQQMMQNQMMMYGAQNVQGLGGQTGSS